MRQVKGIEDLGVFRALGQPNINFEVDRQQAARYQINVADIQDAIQTAAGGTALTQVLQGEQRYDLVMRYLPQFRDTREAIENIRLLAPSGERVALSQLCKIEQRDGASEIYREGNQRYIAIKYSVRGRDLGGTVREAIQRVNAQVQLPRGYHIDWEGEYESEKRAEERLLVIVPLTIQLIFIILYTMFRSFKWALLILANVALARVGGLLALLITGTHLSPSQYSTTSCFAVKPVSMNARSFSRSPRVHANRPRQGCRLRHRQSSRTFAERLVVDLFPARQQPGGRRCFRHRPGRLFCLLLNWTRHLFLLM